jgi:glyoxylase-like metal-dependent hydrolase (beta-lactamase superfamily II)
MKIGRFSIEHLSEGHFELYNDGSLIKKESPNISRKANAASELYDEFYENIGIDPILVRSDDAVVLLDAGLGHGLDSKKRNPNISNIVTNLEIFDLKPEDVTHVVLTHLHQDHIGGLAYADSSSKIVTTLPNATILVQKKEWDFALEMMDEKNELADLTYDLDNLYRMVANGQIRFIEDDNYEVISGIDAIRTGGHTPGHQIIRIRDGSETAYYFGDLIPNEEFLNFTMLNNADVDVVETRQIKMLLMKQAFVESAEILFYHSVHLKSGKLTKDPNRHYVLKNE